MSHTLTLELSDQTFTVIQRQAEAIGVPPERLVITFLEQGIGQMFTLPLPEIERQSACLKFERHFGTLAVAQAITADNDSIDADLAREYAGTHEVE